jgi:hypothetical protein
VLFTINHWIKRWKVKSYGRLIASTPTNTLAFPCNKCHIKSLLRILTLNPRRLIVSIRDDYLLQIIDPVQLPIPILLSKNVGDLVCSQLVELLLCEGAVAHGGVQVSRHFCDGVGPLAGVDRSQLGILDYLQLTGITNPMLILRQGRLKPFQNRSRHRRHQMLPPDQWTVTPPREFVRRHDHQPVFRL